MMTQTRSIPANEFFLVLRPTGHSELCDIFVPTNREKMALMIKGGLSPDDVIGQFTNEEEARNTAHTLLADQSFLVKADA